MNELAGLSEALRKLPLDRFLKLHLQEGRPLMVSAEIKEAFEGLALRKPPLPLTAPMLKEKTNRMLEVKTLRRELGPKLQQKNKRCLTEMFALVRAR